ncbi:hypothetical protein FOYG_11843 [Fusarium oxysporum NRRL 32931]|uniref:Uncharacterized protein n=1 Tax=Fusarium oxysporum NRRL 32931 TaxID=660029 RepID=W9HP35_FUSOX|nr:hypothetical protein FOYG_11843 [Fusarium oxysporum NRRL 32931]
MIDLASIYYGLFLGVFVFASSKAISQTRAIWKRTHSLRNAYVYMIWIEIWVNFVFALVTFLYLNGIIPGNLGFLLATVALWSIQTQLLPQIIANRVALIMTNRRRAKYLKWGLVLCIGVVNIAVCYIWTVAHLDTATDSQKYTNMVFEKAEKSFFLIIDLALNLYFLYLVRYRLIADGLGKYWRLFNFNAGMVFISTSMDILLLGFLSLPDPYLYVQFAPLAYMVKLYIELMMANLISKVVKSGTHSRSEGWYSSSRDKSNSTAYGLTSRVVVSSGPAAPRSGNNLMSRMGKEPETNKGNNGSQVHLATYPGPHGITKTVETTVVVGDGESDSTSSKESM